MLLRHILLAAATVAFTASPALAQSTPAPAHDHAHDHAKDEAPHDPNKVILPGTYSEIDGDHAIGSTTAPLSLIIYASVTCPHCSQWFQGTWPKLKANYIDTNKLRVVFREFPTAPARLAIAGFQIANCAPKDQYFSVMQHQMAEQDNTMAGIKEGKGLETFLALAKQAGLKDETEMNACFDNKDGWKKMEQSMALADSANIKSVPNFIVNGTLYKENSDYLPLAKHLDTLLKSGQSPMPKP